MKSAPEENRKTEKIVNIVDVCNQTHPIVKDDDNFSCPRGVGDLSIGQKQKLTKHAIPFFSEQKLSKISVTSITMWCVWPGLPASKPTWRVIELQSLLNRAWRQPNLLQPKITESQSMDTSRTMESPGGTRGKIVWPTFLWKCLKITSNTSLKEKLRSTASDEPHNYCR